MLAFFMESLYAIMQICQPFLTGIISDYWRTIKLLLIKPYKYESKNGFKH